METTINPWHQCLANETKSARIGGGVEEEEAGEREGGGREGGRKRRRGRTRREKT